MELSCKVRRRIGMLLVVLLSITIRYGNFELNEFKVIARSAMQFQSYERQRRQRKTERPLTRFVYSCWRVFSIGMTGAIAVIIK